MFCPISCTSQPAWLPVLLCSKEEKMLLEARMAFKQVRRVMH